MFDTYRFCKLLKMISEKAHKGGASLNYLFVLENDMAIKFAMLGYHVTTIEISYNDTVNCYSNISWLQPGEEGKYEFINFEDGIRISSVHEVLKKSCEITAYDAKKIAYEAQKRIIEQNSKLAKSFSVNFEIYHELRKNLKQSFDITVNSSEQFTFFDEKSEK